MPIQKSLINYFSKFELTLWGLSICFISIAFICFDGKNYLIFIASLLGATSLIFNAKCNPLGQVLMIAFSILYGVISFSFSYYGEIITYLGMTAPMSFFSLISWIKHPFNGNKSEIEINRLKLFEIILMFVLTFAVTIIFYYILDWFNTSNLIISTLSVSTSFLAVYMTLRRSKFYAVAYAANDIILIILWILASIKDVSYLSVIICFIVFLINDIYGFINWHRISKKQLKKL